MSMERGGTRDSTKPKSAIRNEQLSKRAVAKRIQKLIWERIKNGENLSDLKLRGWVYQFWLKSQCCPMVGQVAELMRISRSEFYRRGHTFKEIWGNYRTVCEDIRTELPGQERS
jgi:hypothetical protein